MVAILRTTARWTGFSGAPGFTVMHFRDFGTGEGTGSEPDAQQAQDASSRMFAFFNSLASVLPAAVTVTMEPVVDMIEDTSGTLLDSFSVTTQSVKGSTAGSIYSGVAGAVVNWRTAGIRNGRRIRGRTFLVPLASLIYSTSGQIEPVQLAKIQTAANTLVASTGTPDLGVYARPSAVGIDDGQWVIATQATVPNLAAVLRSRRD